jgi:tRNA A37 threonylcarbamoyladenosine modification protein TsaB
MTFFFIDSSYDLTWAFIENKKNFHLHRSIEKKLSKNFHFEVFQKLNLMNISFKKDIDSILYCAGPGFYTGLRVAQVFSDLSGVRNLYNYFSYEVPFILGEHKYIWMTKAYRGEYFIYKYENTNGEKILVSENDDVTNLVEGFKIFVPDYFILNQDSFFNKLNVKIFSIPYSVDLLLEIFSFSKKEKSSHPLYYFRLPEEEFKVSQHDK